MKQSFLKVISLFYDIPVAQVQSEISGKLEVKLSRGRYILYSPNANYSYGSLHLLFQRIFRHLRPVPERTRNVLVLGLGAGSVITILRDELHISAPITAVEIDPVVLELRERYFCPGRYRDVRANQGDAWDFMMETREKFDLIVMDLFIDNVVPEKFSDHEFVSKLAGSLHQGGTGIINYIVRKRRQEEAFELLERNLVNAGLITEEMNVFDSNRVIIFRKP